jgi:hypothetical protein
MRIGEINMKIKAHTRYKLADGSIVPGVTTITGSQLGWNKQALIAWANNIGLKGISASKYKDDKAEIGTLAHAMVTDWLQGLETDTSDYSKNQIEAAENSALSFFEWAKNKPIKPIVIEKPFISERYKFGGKPDIYAQINGKRELIDLKTGSGIYEEMIIQVAAYENLMAENGFEVDTVRILNIPRTEDEAFLERVIGKEQRKVAWKIFLHCLANYRLRKRINGR